MRRGARTSWQARQAIGLWLADAPAVMRTDALQIVAELVANVIQHVPDGTGRDWVGLRLGFGAGFVRLEVIDPGTPTSAPGFIPRQPAPMEEAGRGLGIVAGLSARCGTYVVERGRRVVWAELATAVAVPEA
ncbi:ATP-binding protein [Nonomuraea longispora]|uniref:ATP-binding protein n=1 Tax=Nonomuraea longispora TaxID=1848320 RepID=UPI001404C239|nr:ATP-binding protein [Nonomuraea longispora]